jgi:hypothetical protein
MEYNQITKQVLDFQKLSFSNWYNAVSMVQDQAVAAMDTILDQATWIPEEGRNAIQSWVNVCQEERDRFKSYVDEGFTGLEKAAAEGRKTAPKAKKQATS